MMAQRSSAAEYSSPYRLVATLPAPNDALLLLDFDGTLVEIAEHPDKIEVPDDVQDRLQRLFDATDGAVAVVTGRDLDAISRFLPEFAGPIFASHGAETRIGGDANTLNVPQNFSAVADRLKDWCNQTPGTVFEKKPVSIAIHYRDCPDQEPDVLSNCVEAADELKDYCVETAKMAFEIKPNYVSKALAVDELTTRFPKRQVICVGDDTTDERMFVAAAHKGGLGIKVGAGTTRAGERVSGPTALADLFDIWLEKHPG